MMASGLRRGNVDAHHLTHPAAKVDLSLELKLRFLYERMILRTEAKRNL